MVRVFSLLMLLVLLAGCDARIDHFEANAVHALSLARSRSLPADVASRDALQVVDELFGSPDQPRWPESLSEEGSDPLEAAEGQTPFRIGSETAAREADSLLVDPARLTRAAGPVSSERDGTHRGLFREHCVVCHGLAGDGAGPASLFQNPYPRDFRLGLFKWKSTTRGAKPTRADLRRLLSGGVPGTAMPSFALLDGEDLEALVDYVIYLSVRGEVERRLAAAALDELGYEEAVPENGLRLAAGGETEGGEVVGEVLAQVLAKWRQADDNLAPVGTWKVLEGPAAEASIRSGQEIFHGPIVNCAACHGPAGNGTVATLDFDDWTKEYSTRIGLTPSDREAMRPFRQAGAPRPRPILPRNLQDGVFQGGADPETLYRRITQGIAGTPMPSVEVVGEDNGRGLTEMQVWDLVRYLQSLGGQSP
jgi:mono/diheme cytochrome c family protein